jgi:cysteine synthase
MNTATLLNRIGHTPLVPLQRIGANLRAPLFGKCEFLNPGGSIKDRIAKAIVDTAEEQGHLRPGMTIVEATAGNTGIGLALVAAVRGYRLVCVMPEKMSADKRIALNAVGAEVVIVPNASPCDPSHFVNTAKQLAAERGWFLADQFANPANPRIHESTTGPEILEQCAGRVGAFVSGAGTGGTLTGVGRLLKANCPKVRIVLADPVGSRLAHLVDPRQQDHDAPYLVEGIGGSIGQVNLDLSVIDEAVRVDDATSFHVARRLWREEGLLVGGSSGTAVAAALAIAARGDIDGSVVVILADSWDRYTSKEWFQGSAK